VTLHQLLHPAWRMRRRTARTPTEVTLRDRLRCGARWCQERVAPGETLCRFHADVEAMMHNVQLRRCGVRGCADAARVGYVCFLHAVTVEVRT
jgi:hypothetical protein